VKDNKRKGNTVRVVGLISGTSVDAIDVAVCDFAEAPGDDLDMLEMTLVCVREQPMPVAVRQRVLSVLDQRTVELDDLTELNFVLGMAFADAVVATLQEEGLQSEDIDLIASHGQTIYHLTDDEHVPSTLQMGEPAVIAESTGTTVIADFRVADMAAGGLGAPLVPYFDALFFGGRGAARALQNIGGIGNVTFIPATQNFEDIYAFDTGPGNVLIDYGAHHFSHGAAQLDLDGAMARRGQVHVGLLEEVLAHPYFSEPPPKATGRELFGDAYAAGVINRAEGLGISAEDTMATLTAVTVESIARTYRTLGPAELHEVVLAGGGARNSFLVAQLRQRLPDLDIRMHDEFGVPAGAKEAVAFALLGYEALYGRCTNVPRCTGAREAVTLGKIVLGKNYRTLMGRVFSGAPAGTVAPRAGDTQGRTANRILRLKT
jgi:anhydro-N-acetylmuramic acid kinase